jgi:NAD(P)-dependent dehydrogenase (short-subunit alcohol dehydrogenase family)
MTMREEVEMAVQKIEQHFGSLDILVNNAGTICVGPVETMTIDDYRDSINTHFWGPYFATMAALPSFQKRRQGRIINISSIGGQDWSSPSRPLLRWEIRPDWFLRRFALRTPQRQYLRDDCLPGPHAHWQS